MRLKSLWFMMLGAAFLCGASSHAAAETLVVYGDDGYAPMVHLQAGKPAGILVELLQRAQAISGDRYDIQLVPWKRAYEMALRGQGVLIGVSYTQERARLFDFSRPVYNDDIHLVTLKGHEFAFNDLQDLRGKLIGGVKGASYGDKVDQAISAGLFEMDRDIGQVSRLRKLLAGRLDAAFIGNGLRGYELVVQGHPELIANRDKFSLLPKPIARDPLHLAALKSMGKTEALARFDAAMDQLRKDAAGQGN